ncbi:MULTISPECIES: diaminobutyrate--2-oxoglutarate transaminase [Rhizobium]|uniref:diaminobutyrate--2-oxoglutarate transaminase n=1 Tax=Rhizobium TaxID=379 RepID=UPI0010316FC4|nr:diaminobutyrate--2-oxoglutarate transaminase [Rhizobium leguminosarum]NEJ25943.1 diaminobutyrate--2-oxoglutarate transaminase [Rhizobium leguminosarum]TAU13192.1 diaminobutyrate--2-oxoglutarate transaminase [Rhizobium leguminosarum]
MSIFEDLESAVRTYSRSFPATFHKAAGHRIHDTSGRSWIDFLSGAGALNYGHNPPELIEAVVRYLREGGVITSLDLQTSAKERFLESLQDVVLAPRKLDFVVQFTGPTGTNAVEAALKVARLATGRRNVVAFTNGYHGVSLGSLATTGNSEKRAGAGVSLGDTTRIPFDGYLEGLDGLTLLDRMLSDPSSGVDAPAAIIVETVQGEGGVNVASPQWLSRLRALCDRHQALLIVDDIQAGCGRTGSFFSFEQSKIVPDIICLSKSIGGLGLPLALLLIRRECDVWTPGQHNGTFRGNNLAFVAGREALEVFWRGPELANEIARNASLFDDVLGKIATSYHHRGAASRGRGFFRGLRFADPTFVAAVSRQCFEDGLICETCGPRDEVLKLLPPLTADAAVIGEALTVLGDAVQKIDLSHPIPTATVLEVNRELRRAH